MNKHYMLNNKAASHVVPNHASILQIGNHSHVGSDTVQSNKTSRNIQFLSSSQLVCPGVSIAFEIEECGAIINDFVYFHSILIGSR